MSTNKPERKEMTTEERIEFIKKRNEANPEFKNGPPKVEIKVADLSKITTTITADKTVLAQLANAESKKEQRIISRNIERKLQPIQNSKIPPTIDFTTIKQLPAIIRSKTESGVNRANFLIECIEWEKKHPDDDGELHFWSGKAIECLSCWIGVCERDKTETKQLYDMCLILFGSKYISSDDKLNIATGFFLSGHLEYCFELFDVILNCKYTRIEDRAECCKYLYHSDMDKFFPSIEKHLIEIIDSDLDDDTRYDSLACFVTTTGIASKYLSNPLPVGDVNQTLLTRLFLRFIKTKCDLFYVIMACEFLLEQTCMEEVYEQVGHHLLAIAEDKDRDERTRADAADVLVNHTGKLGAISERAQAIIHEIGEAGQHELEKTVYSNKENVHKLNDVFSKYIEHNHTKYVGKMMRVADLCVYIEDLAIDRDEDDLFKIRQSLDRIMKEPTLHTSRKISTCDILRLIVYIINHNKSKEALEQRLLEELVDMANTCSSGHAKRLVNVMVGFTDELEGSIDVKDQFVANIKARIMATIRHLENEETRDSLLEAMTCTGDEKVPFNTHVESVVKPIEKELKAEFVDEGWISDKMFNRIFKDTVEKVLA